MSLGNHGNGVRDNAEILHWAQIYFQDKVSPSFLTRHVSNLGRETFPTQESERVDLGMQYWLKKFIGVLGEFQLRHVELICHTVQLLIAENNLIVFLCV